MLLPNLIIPGADASFEEIVRHDRERREYPAPVERLTWEDMRCLCESGSEIGSHTRTHARVSALARDPDRLRSEIFGSKLEIEGALGRACRYFAWPYGEADDATSMAAVADAGYEAAFAPWRERDPAPTPQRPDPPWKAPPG